MASVYASVLMLPGPCVIDADSDFYENSLVKNDSDLFTQIFRRLTFKRADASALSSGHTEFVHENGFLAFSRYVPSESNYAVFFNTNPTASYDAFVLAKHFNLSNVDANILLSNTNENAFSVDFDFGQYPIAFDQAKKPKASFEIRPQSVSVISWRAELPKMRDIL
jgi:hypothetical protein